METMRKLAVVALGVVMLSATLVGVASAQQYPDVTHLNPFTAESNYMSLPGYFRYLDGQQRQLFAYADATNNAQQQKGE
jgi:hypothetical protein